MRILSGRSRCIMATYVDILRSEFPEIDTEVFDYITGKLLEVVGGKLTGSARFGMTAICKCHAKLHLDNERTV